MNNVLKLEAYKFFHNRKNWLYIVLILFIVLSTFMVNHIESKEYLETVSRQFMGRKVRAESEWQSVLWTLENNEDLTDERKTNLRAAADFYNYERNKSLMIAVGYVSDLEKERRGVLQAKNDIYYHLINQTEDPEVQEEILNKRMMTLDEVKQDIFFNDYLLESGLDIELNPYRTNGVNGLLLFFKGNTLLLIAFLLVLLTVDIYFSEMEEGSYKTYYSQPLKRSKIILSKFIVIIGVALGLFVIYSILLYLLGLILGGTGQWQYPIMSRENVFKFSTERILLTPTVMTSMAYVLKSSALFLSGIFFVIAMTFLVAVWTDSSHKTIAVMILLFMMTFIVNSLIGMSFQGHMFFPMSYFYTESVLQVKILANYYVGLLMNISLGLLGLSLAFYKFKKKDFLGGL